MVPPSVFTLDSRGNSAAPAAGSFAHGGKGTKTPFLPAPSAGDFIRRAKLEWLLPLLPGHWARFLERKLSKELYAKLRFASFSLFSCFRRGGWPHPPAITAQPLRLVATGALSSSSRIAFFDCQVSGSGAEAESISCTARAGFEEHVTGMRPP